MLPPSTTEKPHQFSKLIPFQNTPCLPLEEDKVAPQPAGTKLTWAGCSFGREAQTTLPALLTQQVCKQDLWHI